MKDSAERVGRYQLLGPIGTGPCGAVARAKVYGVAGFERQFAVKRFHPELTITSPLAQALSSAARAYGSLEHPRIARMSEFGVAQGQTFTAVELVTGLDAARLIAEARVGGAAIAAGGALALISQAARAVGYAHGRGLTHLGLAPTNMIVTPDGDVKITDFGILAAGLPQRPVDTNRLSNRIQYLAPEQLANEATSAATDVFQLGVIAYELVTAERTFNGDNAHQVAQAILAGPPAEPPLPRPIVRVLARCLARSPFERFPDARALADALDAALRVAPVPGTRKDVGTIVQATMDRIASLNEGEMSGMLNVSTGPIALVDSETDIHENSTVAASIDLETSDFVRPDTPVPGPTPLVGPTTPKPPIPAPPPAAGPPTPGKLPAVATLMGIPAIRGVPPIKPPSSVPASIPVIGRITPVPAGAKPVPDIAVPRTLTPKQAAAAPPKADAPTPPRRAAPAVAPPPPPKTATIVAQPEPPFAAPRTKSSESLPRPSFPAPVADEPSGSLDVESLFEGVITKAGERRPTGADPLASDDLQTALSSSTMVGGAPAPAAAPPAPARSHTPSSPPSRGLPSKPTTVQEARARQEMETGEMSPLDRERLLAQAARGQSVTDVDPPFDDALLSPDLAVTPAPIPLAASTLPGTPPPPTPPARVLPAAPMFEPPRVLEAAKSTRSRAPLYLGLLVLLGGLGVGGWQVYERVLKKSDDTGTAVVAAPTDASSIDAEQVAVAAPIDAAEVAVTLDAAEVASTPADAGAPTPDAAATPTTDPTPTGPSDQLSITSTPAGARVYIDGADSGVTPLKLPASPDKHTVALLLPGHELYIAQVDGAGKFQIPLTEVTPEGGPAGIKVIKCKDKDRYYVFVDGKPTGMMCPTERVNVEVGPHVVEIYDAVTETRRKWDIVVKDTRLSVRIKVE